jgi:hypothetical protein
MALSLLDIIDQMKKENELNADQSAVAAPSVDRSPAALPIPQKKSYGTTVETPDVSSPLSRIDQAIKTQQDVVKSQFLKSEAEKAALEQKARAEGKPATLSGLPNPDMALTLKTIADEQRRLEGISEKMTPEREKTDLLSQALLAFVPTLIGYGAGRAAGGVGSAEAGIAAGAQAGSSAIEKVQQMDKERRDREALAAKALLERETAISKEKIQALKEAELVNPKAAINMALAVQKGMGESFGKELQKAAAKVSASPGPEQQQLELEKEALRKLIDKRAETLGRGGHTIKKSEVETIPPEGGIKERIGPFVVDPEKYSSRQITKADSEKIVEAQTGFENLNRLLTKYEENYRKNPLPGPLTSMNAQQNSIAIGIMDQLRLLSGYGAPQKAELEILERRVPNREFTLKNIASTGIDASTFPTLVKELSSQFKNQVITEAKNRGYKYQPQVAEKPQISTADFSKMSPAEKMKALEKMRAYKESLGQ